MEGFIHLKGALGCEKCEGKMLLRLLLRFKSKKGLGAAGAADLAGGAAPGARRRLQGEDPPDE